jgi:4,5-DOPA dioxygenase extradiol
VFDHLAARDIDALNHYRQEAPDAVRAHPTEEHFMPLFVALGAASESAEVERLFDGFEGAALAMDVYRFN